MLFNETELCSFSDTDLDLKIMYYLYHTVTGKRNRRINASDITGHKNGKSFPRESAGN